MTPEFVLATANPDKAREIAAILAVSLPGVRVVPRPTDVGEVEETGDTLEENARLKAQALADAAGLPAVADDTGLEVDALGGVGQGLRLEAGVLFQRVARLLDLAEPPSPRRS